MPKRSDLSGGRLRKLLAFVVLGGAVCLVLPERVAGALSSLAQVFAPLQDLVYRSVAIATDALRNVSPELVPAERDERLAAEHEALRRRAESLAARVADLERRNEELAGIRRAGLGDRGRLIPARVIGGDAASWRDSALVPGGALRGLRAGQFVVSQHFAVDAGSEIGVADGMKVLAGELLVGVVDRVATHTARVRLVTDPETEIEVLVGRMAEDRFSAAPSRFRLIGVGSGKMRIGDVDRRYIETGDIRVGDSVLTVPDDPWTPPAIHIGTVTSADPDPDNRLLYLLTVTPAEDPSNVRAVYVVACD